MKTPTIFSFLLFILFPLVSSAQTVLFEPSDSVKVEKLLAEAPELSSAGEYMSHFGRELAGTPYAAGTLEKGAVERLVINLGEFDCTTFVETALALSLCMRNGKHDFGDFCDFLRRIRYQGGEVAYEKRLHYFTSWIESNTSAGFVTEGSQDELPAALFDETQTLEVSYMTTHADQYPQIKADTLTFGQIAMTETGLTGKKYKYIPKRLLLRGTKALKKYVQNGDIIAIVTSKSGLDVGHVGIASWHGDGTLHLLNASQVRKKVTDEPMTLYNYMQKNPSQIGIRVVKTL